MRLFRCTILLAFALYVAFGLPSFLAHGKVIIPPGIHLTAALLVILGAVYAINESGKEAMRSSTSAGRASAASLYARKIWLASWVALAIYGIFLYFYWGKAGRPAWPYAVAWLVLMGINLLALSAHWYIWPED